MSDNEALVTVKRDDGDKLQWAKGLIYRQEGSKRVVRKKPIKITFIIMVIFSSVSILFVDSNVIEEKKAEIKNPEIVNDNNIIKLAIFKERKEVKARRYIRPRKVMRLSLISRDGAGGIPIGAMARAKLITGGSNGLVKAKLIEPLMANGEEYLAEGVILIGQGASNEERLVLQFSKIVFSDGKAQDVSATGYDLKDKIVGLKGKQLGRAALKIAAGTGLRFLGGVAEGLQDKEMGQGVAVKKSSMKNALLNGAALATIEQSNQMMQDLREKQSIIEVAQGTQFWVVFGGGL